MQTSGTIAQINVSQGGVPKVAVVQAHVTAVGVGGDRQKNLKYHGGPDRAVCLWSLEIIETLCQEGHPIHQKHYPGSSRLYARVLAAGTIYPGDPVQILAAPMNAGKATP